jgi:ABC-2 type transport system ATP-binding protein
MAALASAPTAAIELREVVKDFSVGLRGVKLRAVDQLSLRIEAGQIYGLLGPNGSGKSTTIKLILGLLAPTAGTCALFGVPASQTEARREVGYLPEAPQFYRHLTGRELVRFHGRMCGLRGPELEGRVDETLATVGLTGAADRRVATYSKGMLQRIGLAQALVHDPQLLILDEPTAGVDPQGTAELTALLLQLKARGKTVLITSHLLGHVEEICDRVAMLDCGRLVLEGAVADLTTRAGRQSLVVESLDPGEVAELESWLMARGRRLERVDVLRERLDRVFLEHVGDPSPAESAPTLGPRSR